MKKFQAQPGFVVQAFRFALDPNASQERSLRSHCGAARAAYNWAVGWVEASWWQRRAEETYGVPEAGLTQWRPWSLPSLRKAFNAAKHTDPRLSAWWEENSKEAYSTGLSNASAAFGNYAKSKNGKRKGARMGAPRFKAKRKARMSCRFTTGTIRMDADGPALAAAAVTGTGVAGDQDTAPAVSKPRGADQKTRTTRPRRKAEAERAGGATLPHQRQTETRDRTQAEALTLW